MDIITAILLGIILGAVSWKIGEAWENYWKKRR